MWPAWTFVIFTNLAIIWVSISVPTTRILRFLGVMKPPRIPTTTLEGKVAIVTGSNSGIGKSTALELAKRGCTVILGCRNEERGKKAEEDISKDLKESKALCKKGSVHFIKLDLSSLKQVKSFCEEFEKKFERLDVLVNNAGIPNSKKNSKDGFDLLFQVNYLGHVYLTHRLLPLLIKTSKDGPKDCARIINLSSVTHHFGATDWENMLEYNPNFIVKSKKYASSKLAMVFLTLILNDLLKETNVRSFAVNPGAVLSDIWRFLPCQPIVRGFMSLIFLKNEQGCIPSVAASTEKFEKDIYYLQPYLSPSIRWIPLFETMSPFVGYAINKKPMLPPNAKKIGDNLRRLSEVALRKSMGEEVKLAALA
mmetsp:Transcript_22002/g.32794  ORF Transcript_22002/g.32794 Transcript_22002/m.32794 type:complete len:366 (+) Transcript_22002:39-1136(+)